MVDDPLAKVGWFVDAGADLVTFHLEGAPQPHRVLHVLGAGRCRPGRGASTRARRSTRWSRLLDTLEYVLILAIDPGWGGQRFLDGTARRLDRARELIDRSGRPTVLGVDGGRHARERRARRATLGADVVVSRQRRSSTGPTRPPTSRFMQDA